MGLSYEKILGRESFKKNENLPISKQKSVNKGGEKYGSRDRAKEQPIDREKEEMDDLITDLSIKFGRYENAKKIDEIVGEKGVSKKISDYLWKLSGELWKENIEINECNNAKEIFRNVETNIFKPIERIKNNKKTECDISQEVKDFKEYLDLLGESQIFKKAELELEDGFLETVEEYSPNGLRLSKGDYIRRCREIIKNRHN